MSWRFLDDVANLAGAQGISALQTHGAHGAHFHYLINSAGGHHFDIHAGTDGALIDLNNLIEVLQ
ncbi:MAG: hypothetical protein II364_04425, partial [Bacteroidales bacterium]|nr:hypothetical protein [Bacteroidales bacterium]